MQYAQQPVPRWLSRVFLGPRGATAVVFVLWLVVYEVLWVRLSSFDVFYATLLFAPLLDALMVGFLWREPRVALRLQAGLIAILLMRIGVGFDASFRPDEVTDNVGAIVAVLIGLLCGIPALLGLLVSWPLIGQRRR